MMIIFYKMSIEEIDVWFEKERKRKKEKRQRAAGEEYRQS